MQINQTLLTISNLIRINRRSLDTRNISEKELIWRWKMYLMKKEISSKMKRLKPYNRYSYRFVSTWFDRELALPNTTGFHHNYIVPRTVHIYIYTCVLVAELILHKMDGDSDATDASFTLQIMRALDIVRGQLGKRWQWWRKQKL